MGRNMRAGKSHRERLGNSGITWDVIHEAQRRLDEQYNNLRMDSTMDATKVVQAMVFYSMYRLGKSIEDIELLWKMLGCVGDELEAGTLTFDTVYEDLKNIGVEIEE